MPSLMMPIGVAAPRRFKRGRHDNVLTIEAGSLGLEAAREAGAAGLRSALTPDRLRRQP
jgi:hypothetical protein